jgi:hypothetical protein
MKRFIGLSLILLFIYIYKTDAQISSPSGLIEDSSEYTKISIDLMAPEAKPAIKSTTFNHNALRLRAGDTYDYSYGSNQILFSSYKSNFFTHAIKSRHHPTADTDNALDFYVWDYGTDDSSTVGSKLVMSLNAGKVGIGIKNPEEKLHINGGNLKITNGTTIIDTDSDNPFIFRNYDNGWQFMSFYTGSNRKAWIGIDNKSDLWFKSEDGMAAIQGTDIFIKGENFIVNKGVLNAREIIVTAQTPFPDFVFDKEYSLPSIQGVENFINHHGHLPDVPSESEILENGINLGEMDAILLKKIEELMLYIIDQENRIVELENRLK